MALDVQPLSMGRRVAMLLVLLALLGASLGFAELLVRGRQRPSAQYRVTFSPPKGLTDPVPAYESLQGATLSGQGMIAGQKRRFVAFNYNSSIGADLNAMRAEAETRFTEVAGIEGLVSERRTMLGGKPAVDVVAAVVAGGGGDANAFVMLRLTAVPGHVVAICYSGSGVLTDADRIFFEQFCAHGVMIRQVG